MTIAQENLDIFARGGYRAPSGRMMRIGEALERAKAGTALYTPEGLAVLLAERAPVATGATAPVIEVTGETTGAAVRRLVEIEQRRDVAALNFASARRPGGGFLGGARAQEEDLCRASALYPCLLTQPAYYDANREERSALYTDHIIYSPEVPFIRDESRRLLETPFSAAFITAPAPNMGALMQRAPQSLPEIVPTFERRIRYVLSVAADRGHRTLVLGAWGCGAFRNLPTEVAPILRDAVRDPRFAGAFDRVVFAIYDTCKTQHIIGAFQAAFGESQP